MNKTNILITIGLIFILIAAANAAGYWVYSNLVHIPLSNYVLVLNETHDGLSVHFTGYLLDPSGNPLNGKTVEIFQTDSDGVDVLQSLANLTTNGNGNFSYDWIAPAAGDYYFQARYQA